MNQAMTVTGTYLPTTTVTSGDYYYRTYGMNYYAPYVTTYWYPVVPTECAGHVHVFECDHAPKCKCGKARQIKPKKVE